MGIAPHPARPHRGEVLKKNRHTITGFPHIFFVELNAKISVLYTSFQIIHRRDRDMRE